MLRSLCCLLLLLFPSVGSALARPLPILVAHAEERVEKPKSFPALELVQSFRSDVGYVTRVYRWDGKEIKPEHAAAVVLPASGWHKADDARRKVLASAWLEEVLAVRPLSTPPERFAEAKIGEFHPPTWTTGTDGSVTCRQFISADNAMAQTRGFAEMEYHFDRDGGLQVRELQRGQVPR